MRGGVWWATCLMAQVLSEAFKEKASTLLVSAPWWLAQGAWVQPLPLLWLLQKSQHPACFLEKNVQLARGCKDPIPNEVAISIRPPDKCFEQADRLLIPPFLGVLQCTIVRRETSLAYVRCRYQLALQTGCLTVTLTACYTHTLCHGVALTDFKPDWVPKEYRV